MTPARTMPSPRGFVSHHRAGDVCPSCGGANWHVGRSSAECAFCATAVPLAHPDPLRPDPVRDAALP